MSKLTVIVAAGVLAALAVCAQPAAEAVVINVRDFGAVGDGATEDGAAIQRAVEAVNALPEDVRPTLLFPPGKYLVTGSDNFSEMGTREGVAAITHANVTLMAHGATLTVPDDYRWERTTVGGDEEDHVAQGIFAVGPNFTMHGGVLDGNLPEREVLRGPRVAGYGGSELGLRIEAPGARIHDVVMRNWGTDCAYVSAQAEFFDCTFERGRRLGVAVVIREEDVGPENPIRFIGCRFIHNSRYPEGIPNNPGAGIDIECEGGQASVHLVDCFFAENRTYSVYISAGAVNTLIQGCTLHGSINLQPSNLGGHRILRNYFGPRSYLYAVYGNATDAPSAVIGNVFEDTPAVMFRDSGDYPNGWTIADNVFLSREIHGVGRLKGEGHVVRGNIFTAPEE
jgi:hypothetical protein